MQDESLIAREPRPVGPFSVGPLAYGLWRFTDPEPAWANASSDGTRRRDEPDRHRRCLRPELGRQWIRYTGGTLVEKCCHFFDLMNLFIDRRPVRILTSGGQSVNHLDERYDGETPDILEAGPEAGTLPDRSGSAEL